MYVYIYIYMCVCVYIYIYLGFPGGSEGKVSACNEGDLGSIPGSGRYPGEGNGNLLQYIHTYLVFLNNRFGEGKMGNES